LQADNLQTIQETGKTDIKKRLSIWMNNKIPKNDVKRKSIIS